MKKHYEEPTRMVVLKQMLQEARNEVIRCDIELSFYSSLTEIEIQQYSDTISAFKNSYNFYLKRLLFLKEIKKQAMEKDTEKEIEKAVNVAESFPKKIEKQ